MGIIISRARRTARSNWLISFFQGVLKLYFWRNFRSGNINGVLKDWLEKKLLSQESFVWKFTP